MLTWLTQERQQDAAIAPSSIKSPCKGAWWSELQSTLHLGWQTWCCGLLASAVASLVLLKLGEGESQPCLAHRRFEPCEWSDLSCHALVDVAAVSGTPLRGIVGHHKNAGTWLKGYGEADPPLSARLQLRLNRNLWPTLVSLDGAGIKPSYEERFEEAAELLPCWAGRPPSGHMPAAQLLGPQCPPWYA